MSVVSVWTVPLTTADVRAVWSELDELEQQRARGYAFDRDRRRFVLARSALRRILGHHLQIAPARLQFDYGAAGKPSVRQHPNLAFSMSHSEDVAVIAVAGDGGAVGVDIEYCRNVRNVVELAAITCSREQCDAIAASDAPDLAFLRIWTRKEAVVKAFGLGVASTDLPKLDVGIDGALLTSLNGEDVVVMPLEVGADHVASIAQRARDFPRIERIGADSLWQHASMESCDG